MVMAFMAVIGKKTEQISDPGSCVRANHFSAQPSPKLAEQPFPAASWANWSGCGHAYAQDFTIRYSINFISEQISDPGCICRAG